MGLRHEETVGPPPRTPNTRRPQSPVPPPPRTQRCPQETMTQQPDPNHVYKVLCAACNKHLGSVLPRHADTLQDIHAPRCTATIAQYDQALARVKHALITGDTTALRRAQP